MPTTQWTQEDLECERQKAIEDHGELSGDPGPGSLYCHEALHMTSFLTSSIDNELCQHPAITANPDWYKLAIEAQQCLADLYQAIGVVHIDADDPNAEKPDAGKQ